MNRIPSEEDFDRASKMMEKRFLNLEMVRENVKRQFGNGCRLFDFRILPQRENEFRAYIFFNSDKDVEDCATNGIYERIQRSVFEELDRAGRGKKDEITVDFEIDSHENVNAKYQGNYFLRLR